jgi:Flp pilus assembly protein TadG
MNKPVAQKRRRSELGQSLVEFTLTSMFLAIVLVGIIDLGRAFFARIAITDAAGEGALFASYQPTCITSSNCADPNNVIYRVRHATESPLVDWNKVAVQVEMPNGTSPGSTVIVRVSYNFALITPFISNIVGGSTIVIRTDAAQMIQGN